jgi:CxxC motif-containing protein (DUF1111 family)
MKLTHALWCGAAAVLILGPVGVRVLLWQRTKAPEFDADMVKAGEMLFNHEWQVNDPLCPSGDGLGPVFNAHSCVACHNQGGVGGGGGVEHNVTLFVVLPEGKSERREGVIHSDAIADSYRETLNLLHPLLPAISRPLLSDLLPPPQRIMVAQTDAVGPNVPSTIRLSQRNTPALFGAGLIDSIPERIILANERWQKARHGLQAPDATVLTGRVHRLANGKIGRFGWKAQVADLAEFVQAACAGELGLGNPGVAQPASLARPREMAPGLDLTQRQCDELTAFVASLPQPVETPTRDAVAGKSLFVKVGCADCHTPNLGDVKGIYSDLLLHRMGTPLEGVGTYYGAAPSSPPPDIVAGSGPQADEWRTPPLWGVASSAPYLHEGRAATLQQAIDLHGGQAARSADSFKALPVVQQEQLVAFLRSLQAP